MLSKFNSTIVALDWSNMRQFEPKVAANIVTSIRPGTFDDIDQIIFLNKKYLFKNINDVENSPGFIRIEYSSEELERVIANEEIVVSEINNNIIAYYLIGRTSESPLINYQRIIAVDLLELQQIPFVNIGYGCQVCIDVLYRNNGLFKSNLSTLIHLIKDKYSHLLCSISENNIGSMKAHIKNGWRLLHKFDKTNFLIYNTRVN